MRKIKVTYDGDFPNACSGTLKIWVDGKLIYNKGHCCSSTGGVWFDDDGNEQIDEGVLWWKEWDNFPLDIRKAVRDELSKVNVCCGGCV